MSCILTEKDEDCSLICCLVRSVALLSSCHRSVANNDRMVTGSTVHITHTIYRTTQWKRIPRTEHT